MTKTFAEQSMIDRAAPERQRPEAGAFSMEPVRSDAAPGRPFIPSIVPPFIHRKAACACGGGCAACQADTGGLNIQRKSQSSGSSKGDGIPAQSPAHIREATGSGGRPLDAETRDFFEPRLGHDLGSVRIHTGGAAEQSAKAAGARAYTLGSDIVFGSGEYRPDSEGGRRLLAHELTHVMQSGINASNPAQAPAPVESLEREAQQVAGALSSGAAMPPVSGSAAGLTVPLKNGDDDGSPTFGNLPLDEPDTLGMKKRVVLVREGDVWYEMRPGGQKFRANGTYDFVVQDGKVWAVKGASQIGKTNPGHTEAAAGNRVEYAGTIKFGSSQAGRGLVREWSNASGHYAPVQDSAEAIAKATGLPWGDGRFKPVKDGFPAMGPQLPVFQPQTKPPAGGTAKVPAGPPRLGQLEAHIRGANTTPAPAAVPAPAPAFASPVSAKDLAAELNKKQNFVRRMDMAITGVRFALGAWNAYNVLMDALKAENMALAMLNHGTPYWKALQETYAFEDGAKEAEQYYSSLEITGEIAELRAQPGWNSWYQLQQMQLVYLLIEQDLNNSLKSVNGAISDIDKQIRRLEEGMNDKIIAATWLPVMSLQFADAMTFADAGGRMNNSLMRSRGHYQIAHQALELQRGMARAAAKQLEIRLREIDSTGHVFEDIPTGKLENYPLNKFTFRR